MSGVMNPNLHSGFPRQGLHTLSDPRINNTAGRRGWSPGPTVGQGTGPVGRRRPLTNAEMAYNQSNIGSTGRSFQDLLDKWYNPGITAREMMQDDAETMARDLGALTPEENEGYEAILPGPGQYQNPYFGQKQWNPDDIGGQTWDVDYTTEDITETERPRWDILNRLKRLYPFNRGGIASLKYAR